MTVLDQSLKTYYDTFHATPAGARIVAASVAAAILHQPAQSIDPVPALTIAVGGSFELRQVEFHSPNEPGQHAMVGRSQSTDSS